MKIRTLAAAAVLTAAPVLLTTTQAFAATSFIPVPGQFGQFGDDCCCCQTVETFSSPCDDVDTFGFGGFHHFRGDRDFRGRDFGGRDFAGDFDNNARGDFDNTISQEGLLNLGLGI